MATTTTHAEGTYGIKSWDEKTWDGEAYTERKGAKLTHAKIVYTFDGDFKGEGEVQLLMSYRDETYATFVGFQRMDGTLGDLKGTFIAQVTGLFEEGAAKSEWTILSGSGTGAFEGITGKGGTVAQHGDTQPFTLDYALE